MKISVFVSAPTKLSKSQKESYDLIINELDQFGLEPRSLGKTDYPTELPLKEVLSIARHCSGGVILGFSQFRADIGEWKQDTSGAKTINAPVFFPTPWNQLECGILFALGLPLLVFREKEISGGIFDNGVVHVFVHNMPPPSISEPEKQDLHEVFLKWQANVRDNYYNK